MPSRSYFGSTAFSAIKVVVKVIIMQHIVAALLVNTSL